MAPHWQDPVRAGCVVIDMLRLGLINLVSNRCNYLEN